MVGGVLNLSSYDKGRHTRVYEGHEDIRIIPTQIPSPMVQLEFKLEKLTLSGHV